MRSWLPIWFAIYLGGCRCGAPDHSTSPPAAAGQAETASVGASSSPKDLTERLDCEDEPGMVYIPGGDYFDPDKKKITRLSPFWIDRTEVTVAAYREFVADDFSPPYADLSTCNWSTLGNDDLPVNCIDWYQAYKFCDWSHKRLPTMGEWGWAAQGREEQRHYPWGDAPPPSCELSIVDMDRTDLITGCGRGRAWPVGSRPTDVTRDGVFDMLGSVAEKTSTGYNDDPKSPRCQMGSNWANRPDTRPIAEMCFVMVYEAYSDKAGVRCVKDAGPKPPCTRQAG